MKKLLIAFLAVSCTTFAFTQTNLRIRNLVFEGAGIRGIAYCGALTELEARGLVPQIEKVGGTSAGAIMALTLSLGYSAKEIQDIISHTNYKKFNDGRYFVAGGIHRVNRYFGWYRGRRFEDWLEKIIETKTGHADISFKELHERGFKSLYITGTCLNKQQLLIFSHKTYPNMKVKDAVRISMSIPLYFEAVFIDKEGTVVKHPRKIDGLDIMIDGGIIGNFPVKLFDTTGEANSATVGFRIDSDEQIVNDQEGKSIAPMQIGNLKQYMAAFYNMVIENLNRQQLTKDDWQRTISISDGKVGPRIRRLSAGEINILIENGRLATSTYLDCSR